MAKINKVFMINTPLFQTKGTHHFMTTKFVGSFQMHGLEVTELIDFDHVDDADDQIFLLCDNFYDQLNAVGYDWVSEFDRLAERFPKTVWLFWTFHNVLYKHYWKPQKLFPFKKVAFTGEYYRSPQYGEGYFPEYYSTYIGQTEHIDLPFAAGVHPEELDEVLTERTDKYDCGFCGCQYKSEWTNKLAEKYNCFVHYWPPFLDEEERLQKAFLDSKICLGFNSDDNIKNGLPTERTFEGIAYGCVVLTDCKMAEEATDGVAVYVKDYEDLQRQVDFYLHNESARKKKQKEGYEYALNKGTYYTVAKNFINSIEKLYPN